MPQPALLRKISTISTIVRECSNWISILATKMGLADAHRILLRKGLVIEVDQSLRREWGEVYEPAIADAYRIRQAEADIIIDIGANIGSFSCLAAQTHPGSQVYSFEPNPDAVQQAKVNIRLNHLTNIHLIESPVTGDGRKVTLHVAAERGGVSTVLMGDGEKVEMSSVTLDQVSFNRAKSAFFKIDCEGAEGEIIQWLIDHLSELPSLLTIACEHHLWCPQPVDELVQALREAGFQADSGIEYGCLYLRAERGH